LSLGDDKEKTGVYELNFKLTNLSKYARSYTVLPYIMTETVSVDGKTVAEKAHMFTDSGGTVKVNGKTVTGSTVSVSGYRTADITITISLTDAEKAYLDANFVNGMYVEGFIRLLSQDGDVDLSIPYLAFYGDWTKAPMLDVTAYEVGESEMDSSVVEKDKLQPDVYATLPMGAYKAAISAYETEDQIWGLGEYGSRLSTNYYETVTKPATVEEHASISTNESAFYKLDYIYAGLLRGSK
ncbi:Fn3-like domain-containing protein, partial [Methanomethylophilus alvi]|uniref:Fn3-like domain-containing protein n=1 Tax=Methanomethylophilus alvi TaxID=1291540 RepID=UPI0037DCE4AE